MAPQRSSGQQAAFRTSKAGWAAIASDSLHTHGNRSMGMVQYRDLVAKSLVLNPKDIGIPTLSPKKFGIPP